MGASLVDHINPETRPEVICIGLKHGDGTVLIRLPCCLLENVDFASACSGACSQLYASSPVMASEAGNVVVYCSAGIPPDPFLKIVFSDSFLGMGRQACSNRSSYTKRRLVPDVIREGMEQTTTVTGLW